MFKPTKKPWQNDITISCRGINRLEVQVIIQYLYLRAACKPNGTEYYEYMLVYVDDILCVSHATAPIMKDLDRLYRLKEGSVGPPTRYLGADIGIIANEFGKECWG